MSARARQRRRKPVPPEILLERRIEGATIRRAEARVFVENGVEMVAFPHKIVSSKKPRVPDLVMNRTTWVTFSKAFPEAYPFMVRNQEGTPFWRLGGIPCGARCHQAPLARVVAVILGLPRRATGWRAVCVDGDNSNLRDENIVLAASGPWRASSDVPLETWRRMRAVGVSPIYDRTATVQHYPLRQVPRP